MIMMNSFLFLGIGSMKEGNGRWMFPNSFNHPWANSEGRVAQEKFLEVSMSNQLSNSPGILSYLTHRTF